MIETVKRLQLKVKRLHENAVMPSYAHQGDAGLDITATSVISDGEDQVIYGTGLAFEIPPGYVGLAFPRSSIRNKDLVLVNGVGVIDSIYRGELQATFQKTKYWSDNIYGIGDKIIQLVIVPIPEVEPVEAYELSSTERGTGGHGSTGS